MNKKFKSLFLIAIFIVASALRFWQLGLVPPSPDWDEAALGYNAYSILETGKDEYGQPFPVVLRSFDDYKPAVYAYLIVPFIKLNGLNIVSVRLPSAILGILTVIATYFFIKELFKREDLALLSSFLLSISPWHIQFSRVAFEANIGLAFNIFAALFFIKGLKKPWFFTLTAICSALAIYTYQSEKIFTPLLIIVLVLIYRKEVWGLPKKYLIIAIMTGIIVISPMFFYITTNKASLTRASATLAFANKTEFLQSNIKRLVTDSKDGDIIGMIFDNRRVLYFKTGIAGYLSHYNLNWLFITGDINRHHAPGMGLLYLWELPFILFGIYRLIFDKNLNKKGKKIILAWFLIAPIPAAFTIDVPHAVRTLNFLPTFQIFTAIGILSTIKYVSSIKYKVLSIHIIPLFALCYLLFALMNIAYYINQYFVQQNYFYSQNWQYGYKEAVEFVSKNENKYKKIVVSNEVPLDQSHAFFLFYKKYSPQEYVNYGQKIRKYEFRTIDWSNEKKNGTILYIGRPDNFGENEKTTKTINYINGEAAIKIID